MSEIRLGVFTLFGTITAVAGALMYWAPNVHLYGIRLSALVELTLILVLIPMLIQHNLYDYWLYRVLIVAMNLEDAIYEQMLPQLPDKFQRQTQPEAQLLVERQILLTHSLSKPGHHQKRFRKYFVKENLFRVEVTVFAIPIGAALLLFVAFL